MTESNAQSGVPAVANQPDKGSSGAVARTLHRIRRLMCRHEFCFARNIYGDEINIVNARSWWACARCGKWQTRRELHTPNTVLTVFGGRKGTNV
jgi:hypothetical protein